MSKKQQIVLGLSLTVLTFTILLIAVSSKFIPAKCALCKKDVQHISYIEKKLGPWEQIPILHPACHNYIVEYLAPNCDMTVGEWFEYRGWLPRPEETTGKTEQELLDFLNRDYSKEKD